ncbi:tyrosine recombinase XerS, partial [Bacillus toyonensis]
MFVYFFCYSIYEVIFMDYSKQRQKSVHRKKLYENLNEMPFYIEEFV